MEDNAIEQELVKPLVIYHGSCRDGFCAAWAAYMTFGKEAEYRAALHGSAPPEDTARREVYILDFAYKRPEMERLQAECKRLVVLDHHKTAKEALEGLGPDVHFDMNRSGAGMAWDYFHEHARPLIVNYVEDRDLWRRKLPASEEVNALIGTIPFSFEEWTAEADRIESMPFAEAVTIGKALMRKVMQYAAEVSRNASKCMFAGHEVPIVNIPQVDISEVLSSLLKWTMPDGNYPPFSVGWWQRADGTFQYSLRSEGSFDVSEIAKKFDGGGHVNAAGLQSPTMLHKL